MKLNLASSQRVKARVMEYEESDVLALVQQGKVAEITVAINADRRQKVALVEFRSDLAEKIEALGFKWKMTTATKDGKTEEVPDETEGEYIARCREALVSGEFTTPGFTLPPGDDKVKETAALAFIQTLADQCGPYTLDINRPEPKAKTGKLEQAYLDGAAKIIANGSQAAWASKFTTGFTSPDGIPIDPFSYEDFQQAVPADADATAAEALRQSNVKNLALALKAYRKQEAAKKTAMRQTEFA